MSKAEEREIRDPLIFRRASEVVGPPQREKTEEEIRAEMKDIVRRNATVLQALAKL